MEKIQILALKSLNVEIKDKLKENLTRVITLKNVTFKKIIKAKPIRIIFSAEYLDPVLDSNEHVIVEGALDITENGIIGNIEISDETLKMIVEGKHWYGVT